MTKVYTLDGNIINVGDWDLQIVSEQIIGRPFPGPLTTPPDDWDYQISFVDWVTNPLPEGAIEEDIEIYYDSKGSIQRLSDKERLDALELAAETLKAYEAELTSIMRYVGLGDATQEQVDRAKFLRDYIKEA